MANMDISLRRHITNTAGLVALVAVVAIVTTHQKP